MATLDYGDPSVTDFTLDETEELQNAVASVGVAGDDDDEDVARGSVSAAFSALLTSLEAYDAGFNTYADAGRIAQSSTDLFTVDGDVTDITLAGEYDETTMTSEPLIAFSDGDDATTGGATGLTTTGGEAIYLFSDYNGTAGALAGNVAYGVDASGDLAFVIMMIEVEQPDGTIDLQFEMATAQAIDHPLDGAGNPDDAVDLGDFLSIQVDETSGFNFLGVPPGKSLHLTAAANSGTGGVIVTGVVEEVEVNTSNAFPDGVIGYGSQGINAGEAVVMTWVADGLNPDFTIPDLDQNEADLAENVQFGTLDSVTGASFKVQQKVGSKVAALTVTALQANTEDGTGSGDYFNYVGNADVGGAGDDATIAIDTITLIRGGMEYELSADGNFGGTGASADFLPTGQVTVTGVEEGDEIAYTTLNPTERLVVTGVSGNFDIGGFSTTQSGSTAFAIGDAFVMEDDGPTVDVTVATDVDDALANLARNLDETIGTPDALAAGETPDGNSDTDDTGSGPSWAVAPAAAMGSLTTTAGELAALFADAADFVDYGTDGPGDLGGGESRSDGLSFALTGTEPVETTLIATPVVGSALDGVAEANRTVYLTVNGTGTVVEGRVSTDGIWGNGDDYLIVRMTLNNADDPDNATITYEQFAPVQNPDDTLYDEEVGLTTATAGEYLSVVWDTSAADGDDDTASDSASVQLINDSDTVFTIDDDGPRQGAAPAPIPLWEDGLPTGLTDNDGEAEDITGSINLATQVIAGSDGIKAYGFDTDFDDVLDARGYTSGGVALDHEITYAAGVYTLIATAGVGGSEIYRVELNETTGIANATLSGVLDHDPTATPALQIDEDQILIDMTDGIFAIEGDDDPASFQPNALALLIEDDALEIDIPDSGAGYNITMDYAATPDGTLTGFLDVGADGLNDGSPYFLAGGFTATLLTGDEVFGDVTGAINGGGDLVYTSTEYGDIIEISISDANDGTIVVDVLAGPPLVEVPLIDGATTPGGPVDTFGLPVGDPLVTLDGFFFTNATADGKDSFGTGDLGAGDPDDDVNISNKGAAVFDNQFDQYEGLALFFDEDVAGVTFEVQGGTGSKGSMTVYVTAYDGDEFVASYSETFDLPKGNSFEFVEFMPLEDFDQLYITHSLSAPNGFRIPEIYAFTYADIPSMDGVVTVAAADGDLDMVTDTFDFLIEGDTVA